jgi:hypothetical protein
MGKRHKQLRTIYQTDIISRWKMMATYDELMDKFAEYREVAEPSVQEYNAFLKSVEDEMYNQEIERYQDRIKHGRSDAHGFRYFISIVPLPNVRTRLKKTVAQWKRKLDDELFETQANIYQMLLLENKATLDDIYERIDDDVSGNYLKRKLYELVEIWARERKTTENALARLANDKQNIHTFQISNLTNDMLEILKSVVVPKDQKTMAELLNAWKDKEDIAIVERDVRAWAKKTDIVKEGDFLYRNTLRLVVAKILSSGPSDQRGYRKELFQRLWEECYEAVGMCAQGHISRLVNVFVGFDDKFIQEESPRERLQEKMAEISLLEITEQEKRERAQKILEEMNIENRQEWLDGFSV